MMAGNRTTYIFAGGDDLNAARSNTRVGGLFRCEWGSGVWEPLTQGLPANVEARAIAIHPHHPEVMFVGSQDGPYRTRDAGEHWERVNFPYGKDAIYAITYHPTDPRIMYAGGEAAALFRSDDTGDSWRRLPNAKSPGHCDMYFPVRVIRIAVDPMRPEDVYVALEVSGVIFSADGGETFKDLSLPLIKLAEQPHLKSRIGSDLDAEGMLDSHAIAVSAAAPSTPFLGVRMGIFRGDHRGEAWNDIRIGRFSPLTYCRDIQISPHDPRTLYACLSTAARSSDGTLYRSDDLGESWRRVDRGITPTGTMMSVAIDRSDSKRICCGTRTGQVFITADEGSTWKQVDLPPNVVGRLRVVACN